MATLPAFTKYEIPQFNLGDTLSQIARMRALQSQQQADQARLGFEQAKFAHQEREYARSQAWEQDFAQVFQPPQTQPPQGLTSPPAAPAAAPPPGGGLAAVPPAASPAVQSSLATAQPGQPTAMMPTMTTGSQPGAGQGYGVLAPDMPPPSLATAAPAAPPPSAPGLGRAQPGQGQQLFPNLMRPMNPEAVYRAYARDPKRTSEALSGILDMQGKQLDQVDKVNEQIYQALKSLDASPNPATYYPEMLKSLRSQGIPVPDNFPPQYDPGLMKFLLGRHRTAATELSEAKTAHERQQVIKSQADVAYNIKKEGREERETSVKERQARTGELAETRLGRGQEADIRLRERGLGLEERRTVTGERAETRLGEEWKDKRGYQAAEEAHKGQMRPLLEKEARLKNQQAQLNYDLTMPKEERDRQAAELKRQLDILQLEREKLQAPEYVKGEGALNAALQQISQQMGKPPSDPEVIQKARDAVLQDKIRVAEETGRKSGEAAERMAAKKPIIENAVTRGQTGELMAEALDEVEELMYKGVLNNTPSEQFRMLAQRAGINPDDNAAVNDWALRNVGARLTLAAAGGKLGGQVSDSDRQVIERATGGFSEGATRKQRMAALRSLRYQSDNHIEYGNRYIKDLGLPGFGQVRAERRARTIDRPRMDDFLKRNPKWTESAARQYFEDEGYIMRLD